MEHLMGGITGGVVSTLILHPLDLLKIRFAGNYKSIDLRVGCNRFPSYWRKIFACNIRAFGGYESVIITILEF
jgi:hypothetical protein